MENLPLRPKSAADVSSLQGAPDNVFQLVLRPRDAADVDRINTAIANRQQSQAYDQIVTNPTSQKSSNSRTQRIKLQRKAQLKKRQDHLAESLGLDRTDTTQEVHLQSEVQKQIQEQNKATNRPQKNRLERDISLLCTGTYGQKEVDILKDTQKNASRIRSLQQHFAQIGDWQRQKMGKDYVREELKARELEVRGQWRDSQISEELAVEHLKDIAFGLRFVGGTVLKFLKMHQLDASMLLKQITRLRKKTEVEGETGLYGESLYSAAWLAVGPDTDSSDDE